MVAVPTAAGSASPLALVGRSAELRALTQALAAPEGRLLTLTGPPGVGKTALARAVAALVADRFPDGVVTVDLAPTRTADQALAEVARTLRISHSLAATPLGRVAAYLRDRTCLLVLDSCEAVSELGPAVADLLRGSMRLRVLATSTERLHISVERAVAIPPLAMPSSASSDEPAALAAVPSVALLLERAASLHPDLRLDAGNAEAIARICVQLEGLPLALEVAAPRLGEFGAASLAGRLAGRRLLLDAGTTGRHASLRAAIGWSHQMLGRDERLVFRRLAVFPAACSLVAVENVVGEPGLDVLAAMTSLVEKSLVRQVQSWDGADTFTMLDSIREYAAEELQRSGEAPLVLGRHRDYFAALAVRMEAAVATQDEGGWIDWCLREQAQVSTALDHSMATQDLASGLPLASAMGWCWYFSGHLTGRGNEVDQVVDAAERTNNAASPSTLAGAMLAAAVIAYARRDHVRAGTLLGSALSLTDPATESRRAAAIHAFQGHLAFSQGRLGTARREHSLALDLQRALGNQRGIAWAEYDLGVIEFNTGNVAVADDLISRAYAQFRAENDAWACAWMSSALGLVALRLDRQDQAAELLEAALDTYAANGDQPGIVYCLAGLAGVASARGHHERALHLLAAAEANRLPVNQPAPAQQEQAAAVLAAAERALGPRPAARATAEGGRLSLTAAVRLARQGTAEPSLPGVALTQRQHEIAGLVAQGLTNRQIARRLGIAERTVDVHVSHILARLGVHSRAAVAAFVTERRSSPRRR